MKDYDKAVNLLKTQKRKLLYQIKEKGKQEKSAEEDFEIIKNSIKNKYKRNKGNIECLKYYNENEENIKKSAQRAGISQEILEGIRRGRQNLINGAPQPFAEVSTQEFFDSIKELKNNLLQFELGNIDKEELLNRIDQIKGSFEVGNGPVEPPRIGQKEPLKIEQKEMPGEEAEAKEPEAEEPQEEPKTEELEAEPEAEEPAEGPEAEPEAEEPKEELEAESEQEEPKKSFKEGMIKAFDYREHNLDRTVIESMIRGRNPETFLAALGYYQEHNTNPERSDEISVDQAYDVMNKLQQKDDSKYIKYVNNGGYALSRVNSTDTKGLEEEDKWLAPFAKRYNKTLEIMKNQHLKDKEIESVVMGQK